MTGVDEVGAHCGLFCLGDVHERPVGDVASRVEGGKKAPGENEKGREKVAWKMGLGVVGGKVGLGGRWVQWLR